MQQQYRLLRLLRLLHLLLSDESIHSGKGKRSGDHTKHHGAIGRNSISKTSTFSVCFQYAAELKRVGIGIHLYHHVADAGELTTATPAKRWITM